MVKSKIYGSNFIFDDELVKYCICMLHVGYVQNVSTSS
jgi:hypothetical protein